MFESLAEFSEGQRVFSFGKITNIKDLEYTLEYKEVSVKIHSRDIFKLNDWIIFYGSIDNGIVQTDYVENISGIDFHILEKFVNFLEENVDK